MKMSARHAPMSPKMPPEAPTEIILGRNIALRIVPPSD